MSKGADQFVSLKTALYRYRDFSVLVSGDPRCILQVPMRTKEPSFRITRAITWRGQKVPIQAECSACADAEFRLGIDKRETYHQPDRDSYLKRLKQQFETHLKLAHPGHADSAKANL